MNGIIQRPASVNAQLQHVGDILEVRWRPQAAATQHNSKRRHRKQPSTERSLMEALVLIVALAVFAGVAYLQAQHGGGSL